MPSAFNSALETGLRSLIVLVETYPQVMDLQRLLVFDYLLVHSGDAGGPNSLHPQSPLRNGELVVRRGLVERGLLLMVSRDLIERDFVKNGILYRASEASASFVNDLRSSYIENLKNRAKWIADEFAGQTEDELKAFLAANFDRWSREFQIVEPPLPLENLS